MQKAHERENKVIIIENLVKDYTERRALDNINLEINSGEHIALLGPNGAGKTTLFSLLTGLFIANQGKITINGYDIATDPVNALRKLGVVFQQSTLDLDLSIKDNLKFHGQLHGIHTNEQKKRIEKELKNISLVDREDDIVRSLSGGQRRRVELARSLLHEPQILLMDEPTVGLDPESRTQLLRYITELKNKQSLAILWATHLVDEAEVADKVIIINAGKIISSGSPSEIIKSSGTKSLHDAFLKITSKTKEKPK